MKSKQLINFLCQDKGYFILRGRKVSSEEIQKFVGENFIPYTMDDDHRSVGIKTLEGIMIASVGDYIIRGIAGEFYPCKPEIFKATYDFLLYSPE